MKENTEKENEYAYPTIEDYEDITGYKVNEAFRIGWSMARAKSNWFKGLSHIKDIIGIDFDE
jgi:hypothetical protein